MKYFIFLLSFVYVNSAFTQRNGGTPVQNITSLNMMSTVGGNDPFVYGKSINIDGYQMDGIDVSPYLNKKYANAFLKLKNGVKFSNVSIKFNVVDNEIDIKKDDKLMALESVDSVSYINADNQMMVLKTDYPSINKHDANSIYQIIAQNNKIQLLKYYYGYIDKVKSYGLPDKSTISIQIQYYLFNKTTKMIKEINLNKKSFLETIVDMGYSKIAIDKKKEAHFRNEKDMVSLINSMN